MSITIHLYYTGEGENARQFAREMLESGLVDRIRAEEGNEKYEYYFPMDDPHTVLLIDRWRDQAALDFHHHTEMMERIAELRKKYHLHMRVERYVDENAVCLSKETVVHEMKLHADPFERIKDGTKTIELRLLDEKRQKIKAGDVIAFTNTANGERMCTIVKKLHRFKNFEELYAVLPLLQCGYTAEDIHTAHASDMEQYYSKEEQKKYGVVGIELFPLK